jgi:hypothetical protein
MSSALGIVHTMQLYRINMVPIVLPLFPAPHVGQSDTYSVEAIENMSANAHSVCASQPPSPLIAKTGLVQRRTRAAVCRKFGTNE